LVIAFIRVHSPFGRHDDAVHVTVVRGVVESSGTAKNVDRVIFTSGTGDDVSNRTLDGVSAFFMSGTETGTGGGSASKNKKKGKKNLESSTCSSNPDQPNVVQINGTYRDDGHLYTVSTPVAPTSDGQCRQVTNSTQCYMLTAKVDGCSIGICASQYLPFVQGPFDGILVAQPGAQKTEETNVCSQVRPVK
jgi:hypothetical protein